MGCEPSEVGRRLVDRAAIPIDTLDSFGSIPDEDRSAERIGILRHRDLPGAELWDVKGSTRLWTAFHADFRFCVSRRSLLPGRQRWLCRGQTYSLTSGSTMLLEPGDMHQTLRAPRADFVVLGIGPEWAAKNAPELTRGRPLHFRAGQLDDAGAERILKRCALAFVRGADALTIEGLILSFLERAFERAGESTPSGEPPSCPTAVRRAIDYIRANHATSLTLDEISRAADLSKFHLHRLFRAAVGQPIHRYLLNVRVGQALQRLRIGQPVCQVAQETGFSDQAHLTRYMRRLFGFTPARYSRPGTQAQR